MKRSLMALAVIGLMTGAGNLAIAGPPGHDRGGSDRDRDHDRDSFRSDHRFLRLPGLAIRLMVHDRPYYYNYGCFFVYDSGAYVVTDPPVGAVVPMLPDGYRIVLIDGVPLYLYNGTYFRRFGGGFTVVPRPVVVVQSPAPIVMSAPAPIVMQAPAPVVVQAPPTVAAPPPEPAAEVKQTGQTWTVWITNPNGSKTSVLLKAADGGQWMGPKGEYYDAFPKEEQLLPVYGLGVVEAAAASSAVKETTVWIKNPNGSKSKVVLKAGENGTWIGPRGEIYEKMPTEEQLNPVYGVTAQTGGVEEVEPPPVAAEPPPMPAAEKPQVPAADPAVKK